LQRAFQDDSLEIQNSRLTFDFQQIISDRKAVIDVERYKKMFAKMKKRKAPKKGN